MIVLSDNTATNLALDAVGGVEAVNAAMDRLGLSSIRLHNRVDFEAVGDDVRRPRRPGRQGPHRALVARHRALVARRGRRRTTLFTAYDPR